MQRGSWTLLSIALFGCTVAFGGSFLEGGAPVADQDRAAPPEAARGPTSPRDVFVSALERFQGVGARTFEETLRTFVDEWLAREAGSTPEDTRTHRTAVLLGLGVLFDAGDTLRDTPIVGAMFAGVATEEEKQRRDRICSHARLHRRHDAPKHFFLAAALTTRGGPAAATQAGLLKEFEDARRFDAEPPSGSGFSFLDLAYDHAGVRFAARLLGWKSPERLAEPPLPIAAFLPDFTALSLPERIGWQRYQDEYRGEKSEAILDQIHAAIDAAVQNVDPSTPTSDTLPESPETTEPGSGSSG